MVPLVAIGTNLERFSTANATIGANGTIGGNVGTNGAIGRTTRMVDNNIY